MSHPINFKKTLTQLKSYSYLLVINFVLMALVLVLLFNITINYLQSYAPSVNAEDNVTCQVNTDLPINSPQGYAWQASDCNTPCESNNDCPQNEKSGFVYKETSNWCYGFRNGPRCIMLKYKAEADYQDNQDRQGEEERPTNTPAPHHTNTPTPYRDNSSLQDTPTPVPPICTPASSNPAVGLGIATIEDDKKCTPYGNKDKSTGINEKNKPDCLWKKRKGDCLSDEIYVDTLPGVLQDGESCCREKNTLKSVKGATSTSNPRSQSKTTSTPQITTDKKSQGEVKGINAGSKRILKVFYPPNPIINEADTSVPSDGKYNILFIPVFYDSQEAYRQRLNLMIVFFSRTNLKGNNHLKENFLNKINLWTTEDLSQTFNSSKESFRNYTYDSNAITNYVNDICQSKCNGFALVLNTDGRSYANSEHTVIFNNNGASVFAHEAGHFVASLFDEYSYGKAYPGDGDSYYHRNWLRGVFMNGNFTNNCTYNTHKDQKSNEICPNFSRLSGERGADGLQEGCFTGCTWNSGYKMTKYSLMDEGILYGIINFNRIGIEAWHKALKNYQ